MPGSASEKIFSFDAREIKEGQLAGKIPAVDFRSGVRAGGARGAAAPPKFWATQIFWAAIENLGKTSFLTRFRVF